jgi:hypothetical protein
MELIENKKVLDFAKLEHCLILTYRPTFLVISKTNLNGVIEIIISSTFFSFLPIQGRISDVFKTIEKYCPDILQEKMIVIQAFNSREINEVLEDTFKK